MSAGAKEDQQGEEGFFQGGTASLKNSSGSEGIRQAAGSAQTKQTSDMARSGTGPLPPRNRGAA